MRIDEFDLLPEPEAREAVRVCADIPSWIDAVIAGRPYGSSEAALGAASELATRWTADEVGGALAHHPRIGDRPTGSGAEAEASRREQSAAASSEQSVTDAIREGNAMYEKRFDRVFLIRAAGRSGSEILAELTRRLTNEPDVESAEVAEQLRQIALLRLATALETEYDPDTGRSTG